MPYTPEAVAAEPVVKSQCDNCRWWKSGECRRRSPQVVAAVYTESANENAGRYSDEVCSSMNTCWPETKSDDWCGDYSPRYIPTPGIG